MDTPQDPVEPQEGNTQPPAGQDAQLRVRLELEPGTRVQVTLEAHGPDGALIEERTVLLENPNPPLPGWLEEAPPAAITPRPALRERARVAWRAALTAWPVLLLGGALVVYLVTRLAALADFPIYFFTDEAVQTVLAADLVRDNYHGYNGELLPTYFPNGSQYNLSLSVYLQVLPYLWFGKSVFVTRAVPALVSVLAALAAGLALKNAFNSRAAWGAALLLAVTPAWFLHSRTAFETALATTFYAVFLYCYWMYRRGSTGYLYAAAVFAGLTFYSYSPAQMVIAVTVVLLLLSDLKYHWSNRHMAWKVTLLAALLLAPYLRFRLDYPEETTRHLELLNSYWIQSIPLGEKLGLYFGEYLRGLNPLYWYTPQPEGLSRHIMYGYGYLWRPALPLVLIGLALAVRRWRQPEYRVVLIALLAAPSGAALVEMGITRALFMVVPAAVLAGLGLSWLIDRLEKLSAARFPRLPARLLLSLLVFVLLCTAAFAMLGDALTNGPTWFNDYGLAGMQYGARQLFGAVGDYLAQNPGVHLLVSPSWGNGTDVVARFFFPDPQPFDMGSIEGYISEYREIRENDRFVLIPEELKQVQESPKFTDLKIEQTIPYPDGSPGFFFASLRYADDILEQFSAEVEQRRSLDQSTITLSDGSSAQVSYSILDMGRIEHVFDGSASTLARSQEANPLRVILSFPEPRPTQGVVTLVGGVPTRVAALVTTPGVPQPLVFSVEVEESPTPRTVALDFGETLLVEQLEIRVLSVRDSEPAHVHLWEITLQ